jgi:Na+-translocating ferredoxin:NAD+ oxidoreductase RNF subunit RnfB
MAALTLVLAAQSAPGVGTYVLYAVVVLGLIGAVFGLLLYMGSRVFAVEVDPRVDQIAEVLSGANCGACGYGGCRAYAEAIVLKGVPIGQCAPGGQDTCGKIGRIMGVEAESAEPRVAVVHCQGAPGVRAKSRGVYAGVRDCRGALVGGAGGGEKTCAFGCLGYGTCVATCPFGALVMGPDGLPLVIERACTGCGKCVEACPRGIIGLHPKGQHVFVLCRSKDKAKAVRDACDVGCIGCKRCEKACKYDAIKVTDNLAVIDDVKCTGCGECAKVCPRGIIWDVKEARATYTPTAVGASCPE